VGPVGIGASSCDVRWPLLVAGLGAPVVVSAGVCGGLDPRLEPRDVVIPESIADPTGVVRETSSDAHRRAMAGAAGACTGRLVSSRAVVATAAAKAALRASSGAAAVDMESALIAERAAAAGWPALVIRGVSDGASQDLPADLIRLVTPDGRLRPGRALATLIGRPGLIGEALALRRRTLAALAAVARVLVAFAADPAERTC